MRKRRAHQCSHARIRDHRGARDASSWGSRLLFPTSYEEKEGDSSDSVPPAGARSQGRVPLAASTSAKAVEESVSGFGQHTREARSYRAVSLHFVSCCRSRTTTSRPKNLALLRRRGRTGASPKRETAPGEEASDGEPRWQNRGIVDAVDGCSQGHRGSAGIVSMEGVSGRGSRSLFTGRAGKAISAELELIVARA